ncbi:ribose import ATP-binding protein RbsA [Zafaria cholistanensis]|uniref:Ribose import ATP-binding protein RbsA n=1 Tax=Zafaria cholistanensis TaxID=1682741 RepID=A0A5A7NVG8_9MICC|nr:sugar ABC transporter ATP-binding protein [Zafaria cholistanensis]GER24108.1 ribose import ATP-binding protein RbsA [Zafaria cholistanensis]
MTSASEVPQAGPALLRLDGITKSFGPATVLHAVELDVQPGEIVGLVGENGAGKSTLIKVLTGFHTAEAGQIRLDGHPVQINRPSDAERLGIRVIHQDQHLAGRLTVAEQLYLGTPGARGASRRALEARAAADIERATGQQLNPRVLVEDLTVAQQQLIQLTRAVLAEPRLLVLDEPTAPLAAAEVQQLFTTLRTLRGRGVGIIYISHYLQELEQIATRAVVLRNGRNAGEVALGEHAGHGALERVVELMVGRSVEEFEHRPARTARVGEPLLRLRGLAVPGHLAPLSLDVGAGEIVGITGLVGSGVEVLADAVAGRRAHEGEALAAGRRYRGAVGFVARGGAYVPANRRRDGLLVNASLRENLSLASLRSISTRLGLLRRGAERRRAAELIARLDVRPADAGAIASRLSGGNQQKVVLGRWLAAQARIFVLDQPTSGVDVGSRSQIYQQINRLVDEGAAVLLVTVDLEELVGLADRTVVLYRGERVAELAREDTTVDAVLGYASGASHAPDATQEAA